MNVVVAGELPLVEEVTFLCANAGHLTTAYLVEDFYSAVQSGYIFEQSPTADVVMELHNESAAAKQELLYALANAVSDETLMLTSAMATSTTQAAAWVSKPERVIGVGLISPLKGGDMVELAMALQSSKDSLDAAKEFCQSIDLVPVVVSDGAGLVRARIVGCLINEAVSARYISAMIEDRNKVSELFNSEVVYEGNKEKLLHSLESAIYCAFILTFAQGFALLYTGSKKYQWHLNFLSIVSATSFGSGDAEYLYNFVTFIILH